jgi:pyridoxamine 5'-phosphate oxidase-like protein
MATTNQHTQAPVDTPGAGVTRAAAGDDGRPMVARLTSEQVWQQLAKGAFAVLSHVTPAGEPRSSGVLYRSIGRRLYIAVAPGSWKARHVAASGRVAVTVPVRRGGLLSLVTPIPPATISFHATAIVHAADSPEVRSVLKELASLLPAERQASACIIEVIPEGFFVTYGIGVSLAQLRDPAAAAARVPVSQEGNVR